MHDLVTELLKLFLELQIRVSQVLVVLLRWRSAVVAAVWTRSSAHLGIWVAVVRCHCCSVMRLQRQLLFLHVTIGYSAVSTGLCDAYARDLIRCRQVDEA